MQIPFPCLETERLILRPITAEDTDFVFRHFSDPAVSQYLMDEAPLADMAGARAIVQFYLDPSAATYNRWVMVRKADHQPIGTCGFHKWSGRNLRAEIGYDLGPGYWGQGYMSEAVRAALVFGFERMCLNRIEALVYVGNERSIRLLQTLGFAQEGLLHDYYFSDEKFHDHAIFALYGGFGEPIPKNSNRTLSTRMIIRGENTLTKQYINPKELFPSLQYGFSQVVTSERGRLVFLSGQVGWDENQRMAGVGDFRAQTWQAFRNIGIAVSTVGGTMTDVVSLRIYFVEEYLTESRLIQEALKEFFPPGQAPATTWIGVRALANKDFLIEIEAMAVLEE